MLGPWLIGERGPGAYVGSAGVGDPGFPEPPVVTDINGDVTINGKVKPGSFGKFVYPLATIAASRTYIFRAVANFAQLAQQGKLAMVGFGFKNGNDFHLAGLRGDGSTGTNKYIVQGTPPNGWNKQTGHTTTDGGAASAGTQHSAYYKLVTSSDGAAYTLSTSSDGVSYTEIFAGQAITPFTNISGVVTFGVALWFNNADAGPFTIQITSFSDTASIGLRGAQVKKSVDQTAADYTPGTHTSLAWDSEVFDTDGFHSSGDNTKLVIPASLNGYYVTVSAMVTADSLSNNIATELFISKNGSIFDGTSSAIRSSGVGCDNTSTRNYAQVRTHVVQVATGDYFEAKYRVASGDASITITAASSFFEIRVIGSSVAGCLLKNTADLTTQNFSSAPNLTWNSEVYDTDAFHDTGSNTDRITIPAAYNGRYGIIKVGTRLSLVTASTEAHVRIEKGAALVAGSGVQSVQNGGALLQWIECETPPMLLATGDIYTAKQFAADTSTTLDANGSFFSIEILPASFQGVLAQRSGNQTANWTTPTAIAFNGTDLYDTDAAHDPSSSNTKIIVPSAWNGKYGILTGIAASGGAGDLGTGNSLSVSIRKADLTTYNGFGGTGGHHANGTNPFTTAHSGMVLLTTGDEFTCYFWNSVDTSVSVGATSTFGLRIIG